jgi:hypothetical protein
MTKLLILKEKVDANECISDTFNDFPVKTLNHQTGAYFILKALICFLIALTTTYLYIVLRLYTMLRIYWHSCTATTQVLDTFEKNTSNLSL